MFRSLPSSPFEGKTPTFAPLVAKSPFAPADPAEIGASAPEGSYTYALVKSAPAVPAEQLESDAAAVEIAIRWGDSTLAVFYLSPPRSFFVGEAADKSPVDFEIPADRLGAARLPLIEKMEDGSAKLLIPACASGSVTVAGEAVKVADLASAPFAAPSSESPGGFWIRLVHGTCARLVLGGLHIEVAAVRAARKVTRTGPGDRRGLPFQALSAVLHLGLLGAASVLMPPFALASEDMPSHDEVATLRAMLSTPAEVEVEADHSGEIRASEPALAQRGDPGASAQPVSQNAGPGRRARGNGPLDHSGSAPASREEMLAVAGKFGMISLIMPGPGGTPVSAWTTGPSASAMDQLVFGGGDPGGFSGGSGLDLTGIGETGGSGGPGFDLGGIRTGIPGGQGGFRRRLRGGDAHMAQGPSMRQEDLRTEGQIPQEIIQRVVRQSFGRFRLCYENGLRSNPTLSGRVAVRFVIGRDGGVMSAANGGSSLPDAGVVSCVVNGFRSLQFPQIEGAKVATVVYPIVFSPAK